ncbi:unannotated protein [freshwater metagenome]|uniref:Unannotated protein n=1 Tax=freshwater metagenome TaxID=449393 RepID=A0A6J7HIZ8_9ZZZZ
MLRRLLLPATTLVALALPGAASAADWAPVADATIRPGSETRTDGSGQCTSNFVFENGGDVLLGQAAHCAGTGEATETDGCDAASLPLGTKVAVEGAEHRGEIVYSSWVEMQRRDEPDADTCAGNDFALIRLDPRDAPKVNPSVPFWGGPTALGADDADAGEAVYSYGNSSLRLGLQTLKPKVGLHLGRDLGGWSHQVATLTPGVPGDSGSAVLSADGRALGTLSTLSLAPVPGTNGVGDLAREVGYARTTTGFAGLELATGTEPFRAPDPERTARELAARLQQDVGSVLDGSLVGKVLGVVG